MELIQEWHLGMGLDLFYQWPMPGLGPLLTLSLLRMLALLLVYLDLDLGLDLETINPEEGKERPNLTPSAWPYPLREKTWPGTLRGRKVGKSVWQQGKTRANPLLGWERPAQEAGLRKTNGQAKVSILPKTQKPAYPWSWTLEREVLERRDILCSRRERRE